MTLPNLSFMMRVGQLRYVQSVYETGVYRNPDLHVRDLIPPLQRWWYDLHARLFIGRLRRQPFYRYVVARTEYYDCVFVDGIAAGVGQIINIGCGSDTRAFRFGHVLRDRGIRILECDQPAAIRAKQALVAPHWPTQHVDYMELDLNEPRLTALESWLQQRSGRRTLVMLEGVSPYINEAAWGAFLDMLNAKLAPGSQLAYDFKLPAAAPGFGTSERTTKPFRLPAGKAEVSAYHGAHGFTLDALESSADLTTRLVPDVSAGATAPFSEDVLIRLTRP